MLRFFVFMSISLPLMAAGPFQTLKLDKVACGEKALDLLKEWKAQDEWRLQFSENSEEKKYQAPTPVLGKWIQVEFRNQSNLKLTQFSEGSTLEVAYDPDCKSNAQVRTPIQEKSKKPSDKGGIPYFRDSEIEKIFKSKKAAVVFLWTPHMQISIEALKEIKEATRKLKIPLYAVVEPNSNPQNVKEIAQKLKIPMKEISFLDSFDLSLRGFRLHFPSLVVISKGHYASPIRRGHEDAEVYEDFIRNHL